MQGFEGNVRADVDHSEPERSKFKANPGKSIGP